jgi:hypothetical protein
MDQSNIELVIYRIKDHDPEIQHSAIKTLHGIVATAQGSVGINQQELYDRIERNQKTSK